MSPTRRLLAMLSGHRRWVLLPQTQTFGSGDIPGATNALAVFDSHFNDSRPGTRDGYVAVIAGNGARPDPSVLTEQLRAQGLSGTAVTVKLVPEDRIVVEP